MAVTAGAVDFCSVPVQRRPSGVWTAGGVTFLTLSRWRCAPATVMVACASTGSFWAVASAVPSCSPTASEVAAHVCVSATLPCLAKNATGRTESGRPRPSASKVTWPKYCLSLARSLPRIAMLTVLDWLGASTIRRGVTTIFEPGGALVSASSTSRRPETFFIVRVVVDLTGHRRGVDARRVEVDPCSGSAWTDAM